jgi:uncharacterized integral membrane protein
MEPVTPPPGEHVDHTTRDWGAILFGLVLVGVGAYFVLKDTLKISLPDISWEMAWPLILVVVGIVVLVRALTGWDRRSVRRDRGR